MNTDRKLSQIMQERAKQLGLPVVDLKASPPPTPEETLGIPAVTGPQTKYTLTFIRMDGRVDKLIINANSLKTAAKKAAKQLDGKLLNSAMLALGDNRWSWDFNNEKWLPMEAGI